MKLYETKDVRASNNWPYAIAAGCVVYRDFAGVLKVLLLKRLGGHPNDPNQNSVTYNLPKGHVSVDESLVDAAVRETKEESGVTVKVQTYLGSTTHEFIHPKYNMLNSKTTHYFAASWVTDDSVMDGEHDSVQWVDFDEAKRLLSDPGVKRDEAKFIQRLEKYLELTDAS